MPAGSENLQHCYEHSHHFSDKVGTIRSELFKLWISILCKVTLTNHSETLYKALLGYCLDVSDSPVFTD